MFDASFILDSPSGAALRVYRRVPAEPVRGVVLVQHGLAEHAARYGRFAEDLARLGFAVYAHDHRGHGSTTAIDAPLRRFGKKGSVGKVLRDCRAVFERATADHPGLPAVVFGHSMGGLIALNYARRHGRDLAGLAVWNANFDAGMQERLARIALRTERALKGSDVASLVFRKATFDAWSRSVEPRRTDADWLSHDPAAVDAYLADPLCGWTPTISMAEDILGMIVEGGSREALSDIPTRLPLHLLGGGEDPATAKGEAVRALARRASEAGLLDVSCEIVEGARHETLNETEPYRGAAVGSLAAWLDRIARRS